MKVEIWSDIVCPWCYIGKRRFEKALAEFAHKDDVQVVWRAFELDPAASKTPVGDLDKRLAAKYGMSLERARAMQAEVAKQAAGEGLDFRFDIAQTGNTFDAHRLLHLAAEKGIQDAVKERLMRAYFTEGEPISDPETLARLVAEAGIDADEARAVLQSDAYAEDVRADERHAAALGISGVPFFVIDEKYGVSGAQPAALLREALEKAWSETRPLTLLTAPTPAAGLCDDDGCRLV